MAAATLPGGADTRQSHMHMTVKPTNFLLQERTRTEKGSRLEEVQEECHTEVCRPQRRGETPAAVTFLSPMPSCDCLSTNEGDELVTPPARIPQMECMYFSACMK